MPLQKVAPFEAAEKMDHKYSFDYLHYKTKYFAVCADISESLMNP